MSKLFKLLGFSLGGLLLLAAIAGFTLYRASQHVPEFYEQALVQKPAIERQASDEMLANATRLVNAAKRQGDWECTFTEQQINGWLAVDLEENHPKLLPREVHDPRVSITKQRIQIGWQVEHEKFHGVVSLDVALSVSEPNVLALRVMSARAGAVPLPLAEVLEKISTGARDAGLPVRWVQEGGDPVALVTVEPEDDGKLERLLDRVELRDGEVYLAGTTRPREPPAVAQQDMNVNSQR